jgi:putative transposase
VRSASAASTWTAQSRRSYARLGDAYYNTLAECVIGLFKTEVINQIGHWKLMRKVESETLKWVDRYNDSRILGPIGDIPPAEAEEAFYANLNKLDMVA